MFEEGRVKFKIILAAFIVFLPCWSCKSSSSSDEPEQITYTLADLAGTWKGSSTKDSLTVDWTLQVDSSGRMTGEGTKGADCDVSSTCSIKSCTAVTVSGCGSISGHLGSTSGVGSDCWELKFNTNKRELTGTFEWLNTGYTNMSTTLTKQ